MELTDWITSLSTVVLAFTTIVLAFYTYRLWTKQTELFLYETEKSHIAARPHFSFSGAFEEDRKDKHYRCDLIKDETGTLYKGIQTWPIEYCDSVETGLDFDPTKAGRQETKIYFKGVSVQPGVLETGFKVTIGYTNKLGAKEAQAFHVYLTSGGSLKYDQIKDLNKEKQYKDNVQQVIDSGHHFVF